MKHLAIALAAASATAGAVTKHSKNMPYYYEQKGGMYGTTDLSTSNQFGANLWVLDSGNSDRLKKYDSWKWMQEFYELSECSSRAAMLAGECTPSWYGTRPTAISKNNIGYANDYAVLTLKADPSFDFDALNAVAGGADQAGCNCAYETYTTALLKSRKLHRGGYFEVMMQVPTDGRVVSSVWFQSENVEISAISIQGGKLTSSGHVFNADSTISSSSVTSDISLAADTDVRFGIEWRANDDIVIHVDGVELHTLRKASWYPSCTREEAQAGTCGGADGAWSYLPEFYFPASQELAMMIDLQLADDADLTETVPDQQLKVEYVAVYEFDCHRGQQTELSTAGSGKGDSESIQGTATSCQADGFSNMCTSYRRNLCDNPFPGTANLVYAWDTECPKITSEKFCGGYMDWRVGNPKKNADWFPTGDAANEAQIDAGKGSYGHCQWDPTAGASGGCISRAPKRYNPYNMPGVNLSPENCGGMQNGAVADVTNGYGMWCFGQCVRRTTLNGGGPGGVPRFGYWTTMCAGARKEDGGSFCEGFMQDHHTIETTDNAGNALGAGDEIIKADRFHCAQKLDEDGKDSSKRGMNCYVSPFVSAGDAPYYVFDPFYPNGKGTSRGYYCKERDHRLSNFAEGGIPAWRYTAAGEEVCTANAARAWGCIPQAGGKFKWACRKAGFNFADASSC